MVEKMFKQRSDIVSVLHTEIDLPNCRGFVMMSQMVC